MKKQKRMCGLLVVLVCFLFIPFGHATDKFSSFFCKSLHYTGEGMRYWYEEQNGFMDIAGIPYNKLGCKQCHAKSCDKCHAVEKDGKMVFSVAKAKTIQNCFICHKREALSCKFDKEANHPDVHIAAGMNCVSCHSGEDIHGIGKFYQSMRAPEAVKANCTNCHKEGGTAPFVATLKPHRVHKEKLDCAACHVRSTMACYNCHFGRFLETKSKTGNFIPMKSWLLLINYQDKVTVANAMSLVYKGKKFIAYVPYFTHSVMPKGRNCVDCHNNKAIQLIKAGKKVPVVSFKNGKIVPWKGVVPVVPHRLQWVYLDKQGNKWVPLKSDEKEWIQFANYGKPLTEKQLKRMSMPFGIKKKK